MDNQKWTIRLWTNNNSKFQLDLRDILKIWQMEDLEEEQAELILKFKLTTKERN
jgi:hypothetical protein